MYSVKNKIHKDHIQLIPGIRGYQKSASTAHGILWAGHWSGLPFLLQGILPAQGPNAGLLLVSRTAGAVFTAEPQEKPQLTTEQV